MRWRNVLVTLGLLVAPTSSKASMFGEENLQLAAILEMIREQTRAVGESLEFARRTADYARESAAFAREAVQVGKNIYTIATNPEEFVAMMLSRWDQAFPELHDVLSKSYAARDDFDAALHPDSLPDYDSGAYKRAFDALTMSETNRFELIAHAYDTLGVNGPHDAMLESLRRDHEKVMGNLERVAKAINASRLSPVQAAVHTAQAASISARAQVEATATLERLNRTAELVFVERLVAVQKGLDRANSERVAEVKLMLRSWTLDPLQQRLR
jgi:hypothetical protein